MAFVIVPGSIGCRRMVVTAAEGRKGKGGKKSKTSGAGFGGGKSEKDAESAPKTTDEVFAKYGLRQSSGSERLQKKAEEARRAEEEKQKKKVSNYSRLVNAIGIEGVGRLEKFLATGSALFVTVVIGCGIAIGFEAYAKSTGKAVSEGVDSLLVNIVNVGFTPSLFLFFACSIGLGLLKSAQIDSANEKILAEQRKSRSGR
mmetsp:Transcript_4017/g.12061  ORF Transcript_4017/g.12061 Transcript_4017/m.12061 type:complete len:201 (-) Transcript_4017:682-1284(-)